MLRLKKTGAVIAACATIALGLSSSAANAAVVISRLVDQAPTGVAGNVYTPTAFTASSSDLIHGLVPAVVVGNTTQEGAAGPVKWTDGSLSTIYAKSPNTGQNAIDNHAAYGSLTANPTLAIPTTTTVLYDLGAPYNLTKVDIFEGWNDSGRDEFSFTLYASTDGIGFETLGTYTKLEPDNTGAFISPRTTRVSFTDDSSSFLTLGTNARYVYMVVTNTDNGFAGMVEMDVFGSPVPEPTALSFIGVAAMTLLARKRK